MTPLKSPETWITLKCSTIIYSTCLPPFRAPLCNGVCLCGDKPTPYVSDGENDAEAYDGNSVCKCINKIQVMSKHFRFPSDSLIRFSNCIICIRFCIFVVFKWISSCIWIFIIHWWFFITVCQLFLIFIDFYYVIHRGQYLVLIFISVVKLKCV